MSKKIYIYGCGGHAKVAASTARLCGYEIAGFWEDSDARADEDFFGSKIVAFDDVPRGALIFIAFGDNRMRLQRGRTLQNDFRIATIIHPSAQIAEHVKIGCGSYVGALANIDPDVEIGEFCIVNKLVNVSHDSVIGNGTHVSVGSAVAGGVWVGECCCIGMGSRIIERKSIGNNTVIGAGAVVIHDIPSNVVAVGTPAKVIKEING
ncbi:MAG: acetyltransferase [Victivallaceae bacterium]|nr:acetyltransferase [Victivallaceae bacterium]